MKITDTTGRHMLVDLVYKDPRKGWLQAPEYSLKGRGTRFVQVPYGAYAIRICSTTGADVIVHENGERLIATSVAERTQFITNDAENQPLMFGAPGTVARKSKVTDVAVLADTTNSASAEGETTPKAPALTTVTPLQPLQGHGMVHVAVRFAKQNSPFGEPPQEEFEIAFQMFENADFENHMAENLHLVNQAPALPNPRDPMSRQKADMINDAHPHFNCVFSGHRH